jgi:regulator of PEP synthase PpsR (kinase-PPPase family)
MNRPSAVAAANPIVTGYQQAVRSPQVQRQAMSEAKDFHLHLVSDATGETIQSVARACVAQFENVRPVEHFWNMVRTDRQLDMVLEAIQQHPGIVLYTLVAENMRRRLRGLCNELGVPCIAVLDPVLAGLAQHLGQPSQSRPGRQYTLDAAYFSRMEAVDFALTHDDGQSTWDLHGADVVLVGVSRTSKTPTCLYLANRGFNAANIPYVPNCPLPPELNQLTRPLFVGLTKDPEQLVQVRRNRMRMLNQSEATDYVDLEAVRAEVLEARRFYTSHGWAVLDVSRKAIEETAAEVMSLLSKHRQKRQPLP